MQAGESEALLWKSRTETCRASTAFPARPADALGGSSAVLRAWRVLTCPLLTTPLSPATSPEEGGVSAEAKSSGS